MNNIFKWIIMHIATQSKDHNKHNMSFLLSHDS